MMGAIVAKYGAGEATVRAFLAGSDLLLIPADADSAVLAMTAAVAAGRITPQRLAQSVRRVLEIKRRLGLLERRTVPLDSIPHVVGSRRFQDAANDVAVRSLTLVRDVGGRLHAVRARPARLALIAYADELNSSVGQYLAELLRQGGDTVEYFRLWPMSGALSYDSARATIARAPATVFVANVRPISFKGNIALPDSLNVPELILKMSKINTYHTQLLAGYMTKLRATPDGDGSLLDHMTILYGSGISNSTGHSGDNLPLMLLGGGGGTLKGGRHIRLQRNPQTPTFWSRSWTRWACRSIKWAPATEN